MTTTQVSPTSIAFAVPRQRSAVPAALSVVLGSLAVGLDGRALVVTLLGHGTDLWSGLGGAFPFAIAAIVLGFIARAAKAPRAPGRGLALAGLVAGFAAIAAAVALTVAVTLVAITAIAGAAASA